MKQPQDRLPPRRALGDVSGREAEKLSEYFDFEKFPEKADRKVTRRELLAWLMRQNAVQEQRRWHRRLWAWLVARRGSSPRPIGGGAS